MALCFWCTGSAGRESFVNRIPKEVNITTGTWATQNILTYWCCLRGQLALLKVMFIEKILPLLGFLDSTLSDVKIMEVAGKKRAIILNLYSDFVQ